MAETVALLASLKVAQVDIALRVGLTVPTLVKYYFRELEQGAALIKAVVAEAQLRQAKKGVVGAARFLREEFEKAEVRARPAPTRAARPPRPGKKEERQAAAEAVTSGPGLFKTREPPPAKPN